MALPLTVWRTIVSIADKHLWPKLLLVVSHVGPSLRRFDHMSVGINDRHVPSPMAFSLSAV
jgi:hypothetical protein